MPAHSHVDDMLSPMNAWSNAALIRFAHEAGVRQREARDSGDVEAETDALNQREAISGILMDRLAEMLDVPVVDYLEVL
jgi:hypothetical protein